MELRKSSGPSIGRRPKTTADKQLRVVLSFCFGETFGSSFRRVAETSTRGVCAPHTPERLDHPPHKATARQAERGGYRLCLRVDFSSGFVELRCLETHSLPTLARCYPRSFAFYVAQPIRSILFVKSTLVIHVNLSALFNELFCFLF